MLLVQAQKEKSEKIEKIAEEKRKEAILHKINHQHDLSPSEEGPTNWEFEFCQAEEKPEEKPE